MNPNRSLDPSPFSFAGGPVGALLIHGFTGAPTEMRLLGEFLAAHGLTVEAPLLPGHGTEPADLNRVRWQNWTEAAEAALERLAARAETVFVAGLSMGGLLSLHLAANRPDVRGLLLFAPALRIRDWRLPLTTVLHILRPLQPKSGDWGADFGEPEAAERIWSYDHYPLKGVGQVWRLQRRVRRELAQVKQPVIIFQGRGDRDVRPDSPETILSAVSSTDRQLVWLENSGHNLVVDAERQAVFEACLSWIEERLNGASS